MKKNTYSGMFIVFEGLDGSGSRQQASILAGLLKKEGYRVFLTKEPTTNLIGGLIRAQLTGAWKSSQECLQLLFASDRAHHLNQEIIPALQNGKIVISDRYAFSSVAFGSVDPEIDAEWLEDVNSDFILPDITFLVKVSPKICAKRLKHSRTEMEMYSTEKKLNEVWKVYDKFSKKYKNVYVIDGQRDEMDVIDEILDVVKEKLGLSDKK